MVHRPKSLMGYVLLLLITVGVVYVMVSLLDTLPGPWVWGSLAVTVLASFVVFAWRRRIEAARERAWIGAFSFADVVTRRREEEALRRAESAG
jgi:hypothetical protein